MLPVAAHPRGMDDNAANVCGIGWVVEELKEAKGLADGRGLRGRRGRCLDGSS